MRINIPLSVSTATIKALRAAIAHEQECDAYFPRRCSIRRSAGTETLFFSGRGCDTISAMQFFKTATRIVYPDTF